MANIPRTPFFVPRPAEEQVWIAAPIDAPVIPFLTQQKMFGRGGQVPTKSWGSVYNYNVAESFWNAAPVDAPIISYLTKQKLFGAGGQVPAKQWRYDYDAGESFWNIPSDSSAIIPLLTVGGIIKAKQGRYDYDVGEAYWVGEPINMAPQISMLNISGGTFYAPRPGDDPYWSGASLKATTPYMPTTKPFVSVFWLFGYDDSAYWSGEPAGAAPVPMLTIGGAIKAKQWHYDNDDPSVWWRWNNRDQSLLTVQAVPVTPVFWQFNFSDHALSWQQPVQRSVALPFVPAIIDRWRPDIPDDQLWSLTIQHDLSLTTIVASPFTAHQWSFNFEDSSIWTNKPTQRSIGLPFAVPVIVDHWRLDIPDDQLWSLTIQHDLSLNTVFNTPSFAQQSNFDIEEPFPWSWNWYDGNQCLSIVQAVNVPGGTFYAPRPGDDPYWSGGAPLNRPIELLLVSYEMGNEYFVYRDQDDYSVWYPWNKNTLLTFSYQAPSTVLSGGTFYVPRPGDDPYWSGEPVSYNVSLPTAPAYEWLYQFYFSNQYVDDPSIWTGKPVSDALITQTNSRMVGGTFYVPRPGDDPYWSGKPLYSTSVRIPPTGKPFVPKFYKFNIDYSEFWKQPTQRDLSMATVPGIPPYKIRQPSFAYDDHAVWYAASADSTILPTSTVGGITKAKQWHYDNDDFSSWSFPWNNYNQANATAPKAKPFNSVFWQFNNDDSSLSWQQPIQRNTSLPFVPNVKAIYWRFNNDDPPPWQQPTQRFISFPFVPNIEVVYWRFNNDDPPPWQQPSQRSIAPLSGPVIRNHWRLDPSHDDLWSFGVRWDLLVGLVSAISVNSYWRLNISEDDSSQPWSMMEISQAGFILPTVQLPPVIGFNQSFIYDDPAVWSGGPVDSDIIPDMTIGGQVQSHQWLLGNDDPTIWSGNPISSQIIMPILTTGGQLQSHQWLFGYDDPAVWSGGPTDSDIMPDLTVGGIVKAKQWHYDNDDFSAWFPWANRNLIKISLKQSPSVFWKFNNDDPSVSWQPLVQQDQSLSIFRYPATLRQPSFAYDDFSSWQWPMKTLLGGPRVLTYVFVPSPRFATAPAEMRSVDTALQLQSDDTSEEERSVDAPPKT